MCLGLTSFPNLILERQKALELSPVDVNVLLHIVRFWIDPDKTPYFRMHEVAKQMGVTAKTIQRRVAYMEGKGYLKRVLRPGLPNRYDPSGLVEKLRPLAREVDQLRKKHKREEALLQVPFRLRKRRKPS